jgi:cell division protein FtsI (penicillin-binding protein 3)
LSRSAHTPGSSPRPDIDPVDMNTGRAGTRSSDRQRHGRTLALAIAFLAGFAVLGGRAVQIAVFHDVDVARSGARAAIASQAVERADIVDRNGVLLATNVPAWSLYADPARIWDPVETARALRTVFPEFDEATLVRKLRSTSQVWPSKRNRRGPIRRGGLPDTSLAWACRALMAGRAPGWNWRSTTG